MAIAMGAALIPTPRAAAEAAAVAQRAFASPEEAVQALEAATKVHDKAALRGIFGPEVHDLLTGDERQDKANSRSFAKAIAEGVKPVSEGDARIILEIGSNKWPFPIPLVKEDAAWRFDTAAGKEEIINRHIGKDELYAIGVCETYVQAQKQYAGSGRGASAAGRYARRLKSTPGKMDGLYWKSSPDQTPGLIGAKVAEAEVDGTDGSAAKPFHGYFFKVLTLQGAAAPGGMIDYMKGGSLTGGFALAAYPEHWGRSGIMTFIVNQDGRIYQRDFGEKTQQAAAAMIEYEPDGDWTPVKDPGVIEK
jgi:hypothetical protein